MTRCQVRSRSEQIVALSPSECLATLAALPHEAATGSRGAAGAARRARSPGGRGRLVRCPPRRVHGPRRRRTVEGASTTSHADIRWLPRSLVAEHRAVPTDIADFLARVVVTRTDASHRPEELRNASNRPIIIRMRTAPRLQHRYDHRLRELVQRSGDL